MKKKCLASLLVTSLLIGTITGCGGGTETTKEADSTVAEQEAAQAVETEAADVEPEAITLTVWSPSEDQDPTYGAWLNTMCEQFDEAHPEWDITFEYGVCSESEAKKLVPQDIDAAADVFLYGSTGLENLCESNCLAEFGGAYLETLQADYPEIMTSVLTYNGGVYGVPITTDTYFMYYDKSKFSEEDVKSLDTMLSKGKVAISVSNGYYLSSFYLGAGATFFGPEGKDREEGIVLNTEDCLAMTNYLVDLCQNDNFVSAEPDEALSMMREGNCDAYFCGTWQAAQTEEFLGENYGVAPLPSVSIDGKEVQLRPFGSAKAVGVKATTQYPKAAIELAMYLGGYEAQKAHYEMRGYVPCLAELLEDESIKENIVVSVDAYSNANIAVPRTSFKEMSYFWSPAESFGIELRDGVITHDNAAEKLQIFDESSNSSGTE